MAIDTTLGVRIQQKIDTSNNWSKFNPVLLLNEIGYESDTGRYKRGDGNTSWNSLKYFSIGEKTETGGEIFNDYKNNEATGSYAHVEGEQNIAAGNHTHVEGVGHTVRSNFQHVQGKYSISDNASEYAHVVGGGNSNADRKNIHTLDWDGNTWFQGDVYVGSVSGANKDEGSKKLVTEDVIGDIQVALEQIVEIQEFLILIENIETTLDTIIVRQNDILKLAGGKNI